TQDQKRASKLPTPREETPRPREVRTRPADGAGEGRKMAADRVNLASARKEGGPWPANAPGPWGSRRHGSAAKCGARRRRASCRAVRRLGPGEQVASSGCPGRNGDEIIGRDFAISADHHLFQQI